MEKKIYIPPKCVDLSFNSSAKAQSTCSTGSAPSEDFPCWNGGAPTGYDGECSTGTSPNGGACTATGTSPT